MKHPLINASRSLAATVLIALGLGIYGCGDSATVSEPAELGNLSVTDGTLEPPFSPAATSYTVQLPINISSTTITATPRVAGDTIRIDNQQISSQTVTLSSPGAEQTINIVVTDTGTGGTSRSYSVRVTRAALNGNNSLSNLTVSQGTLAPEFEADVLRYTASVANNVGSISITPTLSDPAATMTVNGQAANSGQPRTINLNGGGQTTTITIAITAQNGIPKSYEVAVSRGPSNNNNLRGLTISPGTLNFRANTTSYTVNVGNSVPSVTLRPTLADTTASMTVNGQTATSGQSLTITLTGTGPGSPTVITIIVIAQNGSPKLYSVSVVRAALGGNNNLSALTVSPGNLDSVFNANDVSYTVNVGSGVGSITVRPTLQASSATMTVNGQPTNSGQARTIDLNPAGQATTIQIVVTAQNQITKPYTVTVIRSALGGNSNLQSLTISPGRFTQPFTASRPNYTVNLSNSTIASVTVTATLQDTAASMTIDGKGTSSGQARTIDLDPPGSSKTIEVAVTAPNGDQRIYTITVNRPSPSSNSTLSALSITQGTLSPDFDADTLSYTVNVGSGVENVTVSATKDDPNAAMLIGSVTVPSGTASGQVPISLNGAGTPTSVSITVTAQNGVNAQTYTITVNRAAAGPTKPPTPTAKPDLIAEDDTCTTDLPNNPDKCVVVPFPLTNSHEDNVTTVTRPRFKIPKPATGEAPSLYVGTIKDASAKFDTGADTLQPSVDLSDGDYTITYTLTNTGGESGPSPSLTVTIDTGAPVR